MLPIAVALCRVMHTYSKKYYCDVLIYLRENLIGTDEDDDDDDDDGDDDDDDGRHTFNLYFYMT